MEHIADHCEEYSRWCSNTMRTARSRTSGEYLFALFITPSSQEMESPTKLGRFTCLTSILAGANAQTYLIDGRDGDVPASKAV